MLLTAPAPVSVGFALRKDQRDALRGLREHFVDRDRRRGRYISACGTGKTVVMSQLPKLLGAQTVVVLVPSLNLVTQTWDAFARQLGDDGFNGFIVCSDDQRAKKRRAPKEEADRDDGDRMSEESPSDMSEDQIASAYHGQVLRASDQIAEALDSMSGLSIVFSTYQSAHLLLAGVNQSEAQSVDLALCDEAHFLATNKRENVRSKTHPAHIVLKQLPAKRMLFATATPVEYQGAGTFSMDDTALFGGLAHEYSYPAAREDRVVAPFDILVCHVDRSKDQGAFLTGIRRQFGVHGSLDTATAVSHQNVRSLAVAHTLARKINDGSVERALTYSSSIARSEEHADDLNRVLGAERAIALHSKHSTKRRQNGILQLEAGAVNVITNCRLFGEGYDAPELDAIAFVDPRQSVTDIVQAIGRACRIPAGRKNKRALVIVPVDEYEFDQSEKIITDSKQKAVINKAKVKQDSNPFAMLETVLAAMSSPGLRLYDSAAAVRTEMAGGNRKPARQANRSVLIDTPKSEDADGTSPLGGMTADEFEVLFGAEHGGIPDDVVDETLNEDDVQLYVDSPFAELQGTDAHGFQLGGRDALIASYITASQVDASQNIDFGLLRESSFEHLMEHVAESQLPKFTDQRPDVKMWRTQNMLRSKLGRKKLSEQMPRNRVKEGVVDGKLMFLDINRSVLKDVTGRSPELHAQIKALTGAAYVANLLMVGEPAANDFVRRSAPGEGREQRTRFRKKTQTPFEAKAFKYAGWLPEMF